MAKASDNPFPSILLVEQAAAPATPAAGQARLYRGTDNKLYIVDDGGVATEVGASGGGGSASTVLAVKEHTASALYNTHSTFDADMDATNLVVTFTAPASGKVMVELSGILEVTGSSPGAWSLRSGTSTIKACMVGTGYRYATASFYITGLTPGDSYTYKWGYYRIGSTGEVRLYTGGNGGTVGNALMVVTAMP
jgi:hypothetical protein